MSTDAMGEPEQTTEGLRRGSIDWLDLATRYSLVIVFIVVFVAFSIDLPDRFFSARTSWESSTTRCSF